MSLAPTVKQPNVDIEIEGEDEGDGDEDALSKQKALGKSFPEAMNSFEAVFLFFKCKGYTSEATTTFTLLDRVAVL